jgi:hypothetical protein
VRHLAYAAGWKKFEWLWNVIIRTQGLLHAMPLLETVLSEFGRRAPSRSHFRTPSGLVEESQPFSHLSQRQAT